MLLWSSQYFCTVQHKKEWFENNDQVCVYEWFKKSVIGMFMHINVHLNLGSLYVHFKKIFYVL